MGVPAWRRHSSGSPNYGLMLDDVLYTLLALVCCFMLAVVFFLSKNKYSKALRTHAGRFFASQHQLKRQQKTFLGSMEAEEHVMRVLEEEGWRNVFLRRRVPISRLGHNREIDVVAVGNIILVVEVKHWRGYVWSNGMSWFQAPNYEAFFERQRRKDELKGPRSGPTGAKGERVAAPATLEFENVQDDNVLKAAALRRYIENARRIALPDFRLVNPSGAADDGELATDADAASGANSPKVSSPTVKPRRYNDQALHKKCGLCVLPVVVFTNPAVKLDPATLKKERYVFTLDTFRVFAREALRGNVSAEAPNAVVERNSKLLSFLAYQTRRLLRPVPILRGLVTTKTAGYLLDEDLQDEVAYAVDVLRTWDLVFLHDGRLITGDVVKIDAPSANCMYERKHLLDVSIRWNSSPVIGLIKTLLYNEAGTVKLELTTAKRVAIKRNENKPRDEQGNIKFSIQPKKYSNPNLNDRLFIKPAGSSEAFHFYPIADIKEVRLSHHLYESERLLQ